MDSRVGPFSFDICRYESGFNRFSRLPGSSEILVERFKINIQTTKWIIFYWNTNLPLILWKCWNVFNLKYKGWLKAFKFWNFLEILYLLLLLQLLSIFISWMNLHCWSMRSVQVCDMVKNKKTSSKVFTYSGYQST